MGDLKDISNTNSIDKWNQQQSSTCILIKYLGFEFKPQFVAPVFFQTSFPKDFIAYT